jgi:hypothetical protein
MDKSLFYHFTSEKSLLIARHTGGIREGIVPVGLIPDAKNLKRNVLKFVKNTQWLTTDPKFIGLNTPLGPAKSSMLPGRKAQYRLTIKVPKEYRSNIVHWPKFARALIKDGYDGLNEDGSKVNLKLDPKMEAEINMDLLRPEQWWIFGGWIPFGWIVGFEKNPDLPPDVADLSTGPATIMSFPKIDVAKKVNGSSGL